MAELRGARSHAIAGSSMSSTVPRAERRREAHRRAKAPTRRDRGIAASANGHAFERLGPLVAARTKNLVGIRGHRCVCCEDLTKLTRTRSLTQRSPDCPRIFRSLRAHVSLWQFGNDGDFPSSVTITKGREMRVFRVVLPLLAAIGCTSSTQTRPPVEELDEGLNLLDASDPSWGINAAFRAGDSVVYIEQRVGALKPAISREDSPNEPANEMDMRFIDKNGITFYVERGGDLYVEPTWNDDIRAAFDVTVPDAQRAADFTLARDGAAALAKIAATNKALVPFGQIAAVHAARPTPQEDPELIAGLAKIQSEERAYDLNNWSGIGSWKLKGDLWSKKKGCSVWYCPAQHSAVRTSATQNGTSWQIVLTACNHGSCAGDSEMNYKCTSTTSNWVTNPSITTESHGGSSIGGGCLTEYGWNSSDNDHLCNDDAAYEIWQAKNGTIGGTTRDTNGNGNNFVYTATGVTSNPSWEGTSHWACNCSHNAHCDNDWARMEVCP